MKPFFIYLLLSVSIFSFGQDLPDLTTYSKTLDSIRQFYLAEYYTLMEVLLI